MKKSSSLLIGCARVSKADAQDAAIHGESAAPGWLQTDFRREGLWWPVGSAGTSPGLGATQGRDVLVVWKLDRLSRSLKDLLHIMERVREAGAGFRSLTEAVDTTTAAGRR